MDKIVGIERVRGRRVGGGASTYSYAHKPNGLEDETNTEEKII
jgi:hypothetical protein